MRINIAMETKLLSRIDPFLKNYAVFVNYIIWAACFVLALCAGLSAVGAVTKTRAPDIAIALMPLNGFAAETIASRSLKAQVAADQGQFPEILDPSSIGLAELAFVNEPATPGAVAVLALGKAGATEKQLMQHALTLSRRERLVVGWHISDDVALEDIPAILNSYDILIRTSNSASSTIMPVMASALVNEKFIEPMADLLSEKPPWATRFWRTVPTVATALTNAAQLRESLYSKAERSDAYRDVDLVTALVNAKEYARAEKLYNLVVSDSPQDSLVRNSLFDGQKTNSPLDWRIFSTGEYGASINGGNLHLSAIASSGGLFARQLVRLPASMLTIDIAMSDKKPESADLYVNLSCAETSAIKPVKIPLDEARTIRKINNSGSGCKYYWLDISGNATDAGNGFDVYLNSFKISASDAT